ncbi:MAG: AraC family transcriptional regulator [Oculatellaceae cyanobacterium Prado106]|nr:AraC family transcriptional regulator [Oculatellaceae cyanobacterium Prado106]
MVQDEGLAQQVLELHQILEQSPHPLEQQSQCVEILSSILQHHANLTVRTQTEPLEHQAVRLIKAYLNENFSNPISLEQLVELTQLNRSYLIRVFRQTVGMPPYTYLNQIRVEKAKQLLQQGMEIAAVAIAVGLSDQSHLTRHFKQIVGITPGQYRKTIALHPLQVPK